MELPKDMVEKRDQRKNPGIRGVDRVIRGNSGRGRKAHLGVRVFVYLGIESYQQNAINVMYKRIPVRKLTGSEQFKNVGERKFTVLDFWRYGFSNLNSNVLRGALAEFIVENALRGSAEIDVRNPWGDSDVISPNGKKIEVKCCSYIQDWDQNDYSRVVWSGLKAKELFWSSAVSQIPVSTADYKSDIYVLVLFKHKDHATLDILDMEQWCFWVLTKDKIRELSKNGNSVSLIKLQKLNIEPVSFQNLRENILSMDSGNRA